ncbi:MAG: glycerol-3-phosphate dehydrogenase/oxidase [Acidobacteriota bacterium]
MFLPYWRERAWERLAAPVDLLVVGGGITGAGVLHDAALRGLRVALVEQGDFASGTSSRSSKLIHGGLRYLKRMQLWITRTACRERDLLSLLDPHLVWGTRFLYPSYKHDLTPGWQVDLGLTMYDHLTPVRHRHERITAAAARKAVPQVARDGLEFGLLYDDAVADDARLVLAVVEAGLLAGGVALNYARVEELLRNAKGKVAGAVVRDLESGATHEIRAAVTVNATGAWCDSVRAMLGNTPARLRPSRGSHLLFPRHRLPLDLAVTALSAEDGRPVFAVPHPEGTLIGTTDLFHTAALADPRPSEDEISYLLRFSQTVFPGARLKRADISGAFAGVRPILDSGAESPAEASREEEIWEEQGLLSTAGGKLTTFRATAEEVVDEALKLLPEARRAVAIAPSTAAVALPWRVERGEAAHSLVRTGIDEKVANGLLRRLGAAALPLVASSDAKELAPVADGLDLCPAELVWHLRAGGVIHLEDLLLRRIRMGMWQPQLTLELAPGLRAVLRRAAGWSVARWNAELERLAAAVGNWMPPEPALAEAEAPRRRGRRKAP